MRKVNITKQDIVKPKAFLYGLSLKQIIIMGIGIAVSVGIFYLLYFVCGADADLALMCIFINLVIFGAGGILKINGISFLSWLIMTLKGPINRNYISKGVKDYYVQEEETK